MKGSWRCSGACVASCTAQKHKPLTSPVTQACFWSKQTQKRKQPEPTWHATTFIKTLTGIEKIKPLHARSVTPCQDTTFLGNSYENWKQPSAYLWQTCLSKVTYSVLNMITNTMNCLIKRMNTGMHHYKPMWLSYAKHKRRNFEELFCA